MWLGSIEVDLVTGTVRRAGQVSTLLEKERALLAALWEVRGEVVPRSQLLRDVWGYSDKARSRTVDTTLRRLRQKVEERPGEPVFLRTLRGQGIQLVNASVERPPHAARIRVSVPHPAPVLGREDDLSRVLAMVERSVLLVTAAAGLGKTALLLTALEAWARGGGSSVYVDAARLTTPIALGSVLAPSARARPRSLRRADPPGDDVPPSPAGGGPRGGAEPGRMASPGRAGGGAGGGCVAARTRPDGGRGPSPSSAVGGGLPRAARAGRRPQRAGGGPRAAPPAGRGRGAPRPVHGGPLRGRARRAGGALAVGS